VVAIRDNIWTTKDVNGDLCDLPYALAKYLQGLLYKVVDYIPTPSQQRLDADLLFKILGHMQPYERYGAAGSTAQLAIFSHIKITHPRSDRMHMYVRSLLVPLIVNAHMSGKISSTVWNCLESLRLTCNRAMADDVEGVPVATHAVPRQNL